MKKTILTLVTLIVLNVNSQSIAPFPTHHEKCLNCPPHITGHLPGHKMNHKTSLFYFLMNPYAWAYAKFEEELNSK